MGRFLKLNQDISKLGMEVLNNQDLCKLLHYPEYDPLSMPYVDGFEHVYDKRLLMFYPKVLIDNESEEVGSYLIIRPFNLKPASGDHFRVTMLLFEILVHHSARRIKGGDRVMCIADIIEDMMNDTRLSIGKSNFYDCVEIANTNMTYSGFKMVYKDVDFK